jgi:hypothetical protein
MTVAIRSGVSLVWVGVILVIVAIAAAALIVSYSNIYATAAQPCPSNGCEGVTSESSSSLMAFTIGPRDVSTTFEYPGTPASFKLGTFTFKMIYNDTGYVDANGTQYPGFEVVFDIANRTQSETQVVAFGWSPITPPGNTSSGFVTMEWTAASSAYPNVKGQVAFLTLTVYEKPPNY